MEAEVAATLSRLGLAETDLGIVGATIARRSSDTAPGPLPAIALSAPDADLVPGDELGRGGMGIVRVASQRSLGREVALKTVARNEPEVARALLREARVMGGLEHPNIVPVHALGVDREGAPVLVMKRIEGSSWRALLVDPDHPAWGPLLAGHGDRLRAHVEILMQVARALSFAHDRGVVHRDLKPENVMLGRFGEVYLLDWGVALRLAERDVEPSGIVGTPGYLAPEMVHGDPHAIDARTDVYLLGATLYEILSGRRPHEAPTPLGALALALAGDREPLADAPPELGDLVDAAMALDPARRPESAEAVRAALAGFLASREADTLVREAQAAFERAAALPPESPAASRALIEARFALTSALRLREDPAIRRHLDACLVRLAERELALRSPGGARTHLSEMSTVPPALLADVERLEKVLDAERAAALANARDRSERDLAPLWRVMAGLWVLAFLAFVAYVVAQDLTALSLLRPIDVIGAQAPIYLLAIIGLFVVRRRVLANTGTRTLVFFIALWSANALGIAVLGHWRGDAVYDDQLSFVTGTIIVALGCVTVLPEYWPVIILHLLTLGALTVAREHSVMIHLVFFLLNLPILTRALWLRAKRTRTE